MTSTFMGYGRPDGKVGVRNLLMILPTTPYANKLAVQLAEGIPEAVALPHEHGLGQRDEDMDLMMRMLTGFVRHPNVAACLILDFLGRMDIAQFVQAGEEHFTPVEVLDIRAAGGTLKAKEQGAALVSQLVAHVRSFERREFPVSELILASECGGSDFTSGIVSNPSLGAASDRIVAAGGAAMFSETTEIIGAEHVVARNCASEAVAARLLEIVARYEKSVMNMGHDMRWGNPSAGNIEGGLTTIEEKSLGCIAKGGTSPVQGVLEFAEPVPGKGLYIMDTPGYDVESVCAMVAGGAQVVVFTTGRGTPTGCPIAPVIKVTANPLTGQKMRDNIDVDLSWILQGQGSIDEGGQNIFEAIIRAATGELTKAEQLGHREFGITRIARSA